MRHSASNGPLHSGIFNVRFNRSRLWLGSILVGAFLIVIGGYAIHNTNAHSAGITGYTQKTSSSGCYCHCSTSNSATTVTISTTATTFYTGQTYMFTASVANSSEVDGGIDISTEFGTLSAISGQGLYLSSGELTHSSPKALTASWNFDWTASSTPGYDTIFATGNAVNGDGSNGGGDCSDKWNFAPKYVIHVLSSTTKRLALSRSSISLGQVRVGHRIADSLVVSSTGTGNITISSSGMKSGSQFSSYPTTSNRTINSGATEMDSVIFAPSVRGTFSDSLIFSTNSDTVPDQRIGVAVSGTGIQAVFSSTNGNTLAFGNLRAGRMSQLTFQFSNTGNDTLFLTTPALSGSGFSIVSGNSSMTLLPNQSGSVGVQFAPTAKQAYSGTITFSASNGITTPTVNLSGTGVLPQLQISAPQDLGLIRVGQTLHGTISFQNTGTDTLHISNASLIQKASKFTLGTYDVMVAPGASGMFHLTYSPDTERMDSAVLHFASDDPTDSNVSLTVTGSGVLPHMVVAQKGDTIDLGQVKVNARDTQDIAVTNDGSTDLNLLNITGGPAPFGVASYPTVVASEVTAYIGVTFSPTSTGTFQGMLVIQGDDPNNQFDTVYLKGEGINSSLTITPANLSFGSVPVGSTAVDTIVLANSGSAGLNIQSYRLSPASGAFAILDSSAHQVAGSNSVHVIVRFQPDTAGSYSGVVTITSDDASSPVRTINLSGIGVKGQLVIVPTAINFGNITVGKDSSISVMARNSGQATVTISSVTFTGPGASAFSDASITTPLMLPPGDSTKFNVIFTPSAAQSYQGMTRLLLGDGSSQTVYMQGMGSVEDVSNAGSRSAPFALVLSPNPAKDMVILHVSVVRTSGVTMDLFDAAGTQLIERSLGEFAPGSYDVTLSVSELSSGNYFVRIRDASGNAVGTKLVLDR